jgi:hypothetical protein
MHNIRRKIPVWGASYREGYGSGSGSESYKSTSEYESADLTPEVIPEYVKSEVIIYEAPDALLAKTTLRQAAPTSVEELESIRDDYGDGTTLFDYKCAYTTFKMKELRTIYETIPSMDSLEQLRCQDIIITGTDK